ncbi:MAG: hypothetical protein HZB77_00815 [Chloroflexi bacterium]|nr:hypothetical protein [Chloroflexota bacterium]
MPLFPLPELSFKFPSNCQSPLTEPDTAESAFGASGARFGCAGGATRKGLGVDNGGMKPFGVVRSVGVEVVVKVGVREGVIVEVLVEEAEVLVRVAVLVGVAVCVGVGVFERATAEVVCVAVLASVDVCVEVGVLDGATVKAVLVAVAVLVSVAVADGVRVGVGVGVVCATFAALRESEDKTRTANVMSLPTWMFIVPSSQDEIKKTLRQLL